MAKPMNLLKKRRTTLQFITLTLIIVCISYFSTYAPVLLNHVVHSGWTLFVLFTLLALYNVRKKLPYPSLFKSSSWLQFHVYGGCIATLVFFIHTGVQFPSGVFDTFLYWNVIFLVLSGFIGLWLTRTLPKRLTDIGQEVIYERIPQFRLQCLEQADQIILQTVEQHSNEALEEYYLHTLRPYLSEEPNCVVQFFSSNRNSHLINTELNNLKRYLNDAEKVVADELKEIVCRRADLDDHFAYQHILKSWLFFHIPLTFSLFVLAAMHLVLVYAF